MIRQLAVLEDANFLRGAGTVFAPKGMRNLAAAANILVSQSSFSVTTAIQDMTSLVNALESAFVPMSTPHWFNNAGPKEQAVLIVRAGAKARGRSVPQLDRPKFDDVDESTKLAALIIRAGQRRRGELP